MLKLIAALILSISSVGTVVFIAPPSFLQSEQDGNPRHAFAAPEMDASSAMGALTLLVGGVLVLRRRVATKR
ncbi:MAG TPA: hypothetical protein VK794_01150 [Steroidobacteraceae bacterium]|jgi:hypothetical protein|nr:hypothetical protein [Steroidobacteraceae bacterium]